MAFSRRRGRPKKTIHEGKDKGTIELIQKRSINLTTEPLDLCFQRDLINNEQHNAGIRFRWLYTLKFGAPSPSSYLPDNLGGHSCKYEDNEWMQNRQHEYNLMIKELDKIKSRQAVMDICIFSHPPSFLYTTPNCLTIRSLSTYKELQLLQSGLDAISTLLKCKNMQNNYLL